MAVPPSSPGGSSRAALIARLVRLRASAGLSGNALARRMGVYQSRVWKIEHFELMPREDDIDAWVAAAGGDEATAAELNRMLKDAQAEQAFKSAFGRSGGAAGYQDRIREIEAAASRLGVFQVAVIPGIMQTADYARALLGAPASGLRAWDTDDAGIEAAVSARLRRQEVLHDPGKRIQVVLGEGALRTLVVPPEVLAGQLAKLASVARLPSVELGIIGFGQRMPAYPLGFRLYDDDLAVVESIVAEHYYTADTDPDEVATFLKAFSDLREAAVTGADAEAIITAAARQIGA